MSSKEKRQKLTEEQKLINIKASLKKYYENNKARHNQYYRQKYNNLSSDAKIDYIRNANINQKNRVENMDDEQYKKYIEYIQNYNSTHKDKRSAICQRYNNKVILKDNIQVMTND